MGIVGVADYYHVRVTTRSRKRDEVVLDLSRDDVERRVITPYRDNRPMIISGTAIKMEDIDRIRISKTTQQSSQVLPLITAERINSSIVVFGGPSDQWLVADRGIDVTDEFINEASLPVASSASATPQSVAIVEQLATNFHYFVDQLRHRHAGRPPLEINDEYDVQDSFHALLRLFFDDIRDEEWTPSYAGGASRLDFLLSAEEVVVEIKKTRTGLRDREVGEQLSIDIRRY